MNEIASISETFSMGYDPICGHAYGYDIEYKDGKIVRNKFYESDPDDIEEIPLN